jgi:hypothetical protein
MLYKEVGDLYHARNEEELEIFKPLNQEFESLGKKEVVKAEEEREEEK